VLAICASFRATSLLGSRDAGRAVEQGGNKNVIESNGNLNKKQKNVPIMLASVKQEF